ncbi:MAG TPA: VTT domain-containing protein [Verrucomicrobiales bacterium]|jgi:membrane-associated protein|nr:VTT domain-containing protein [Verrucomicrobiales bacterium]
MHHSILANSDMNFFQQAWDVITNLQQYVQWWVEAVGPWNLTLILFLIIFSETGLVVMPWLPGDSLLFVAGALCGPKEGIQYTSAGSFSDSLSQNWEAIKYAAQHGQLTLLTLVLLLPLAAILGDNLNYWIGHYFGPRIFKKPKSVFFNADILHRTQGFYDKHGTKMVLLARFVPLVRTFAPFVAGVGQMNYKKFFAYGGVGAFLWVFVCCTAGFLFGNISWVKEHFEIIVIAVICISVAPAIMAWVQARKEMKRQAAKSDA